VAGVHPSAWRPDSGDRLFHGETTWLKTLYVLFFIELGRRTIHLAGVTAHPTGDSVVQQARNLSWKLQDGALNVRFLLRDRDAKFTTGFDQVFRSEGVEVIRLPFRAPRANAIAERWVGTARREVGPPADLWPTAS
jgi:putative transposase